MSRPGPKYTQTKAQRASCLGFVKGPKDCIHEWDRPEWMILAALFAVVAQAEECINKITPRRGLGLKGEIHIHIPNVLEGLVNGSCRSRGSIRDFGSHHFGP